VCVISDPTPVLWAMLVLWFGADPMQPTRVEQFPALFASRRDCEAVRPVYEPRVDPRRGVVVCREVRQ
jgi:hypothetical protein